MEYRVYYLAEDDHRTEVEFINTYAKEGWRLIQVRNLSSSKVVAYYFERVKS